MRHVKTFADVGKEVLDTKINRAPKTLNNAELHIEKHLVPWFNVNCPYIDDVTETHWERYITDKRATRPTMKFLNHHKYLRMILKHAFDRGYVKRRIKIANPDLPTQAGKEFSTAEIRKLLKAASKDLNHQIVLAIHTGMRKGEILHLKWSRVDLKERVINLLPEDTKTRYGRSFPLTPEAVDVLKSRITPGMGEYVFRSRYDHASSSTSNKTAWKACKRRAKVTGRFHDFRHTFVRNALDQGVAPVKVAKYTGMSLQVLDEVYGQLKASQMLEVVSINSGKFRELIK